MQDMQAILVRYEPPDNSAFLYDPQLSRAYVAKELGVCLRTLYDYMTWGADFNPNLRKYLNEYGGLNRRKIDSRDFSYIEEIHLLRQQFTKDRVAKILTSKYIGA